MASKLVQFVVLAGVLSVPAVARADIPFIGELRQIAFGFCPAGWAPAEGQLLGIGQNTALFSLIGTTYGGDGQSTFALPDLRARMAVHKSDQVPQGARSGSTTVALLAASVPDHTHTAVTTVSVTSALKATPALATSGTPASRAVAQAARTETDKRGATTRPQPTYHASAPTVAMASGAVQSTATAETSVSAGAGSPDAVPIQAPYLGQRYCIALEGIFPARD
jgi:microcystin-dependent protein